MHLALAACGSLVLSQALRTEITQDPGKGYDMPSTESGCQCVSDCYAVAEDNFNCDRCDTTEKCGTFDPKTSGWYDQCIYPKHEEFENKTFEEKLTYYWDKILENPNPASYSAALFNKFFIQGVPTAFDNWLPEMPSARAKSLHSVGAMCKVEFQVKSSKYTGILGAGSHQGLIRVGPAFPPSDKGLVAGIGLKFPRSKVHNADLVSMQDAYTLAPNYFVKNMSNHIVPSESAIAKRFEQATLCSAQVGLSDWAKYSQTGEEFTPEFPYKLFYIPSTEVQSADQVTTIDGLKRVFESYPVGTHLYTVYACDSASEHEDESAGSLERHCAGEVLLGTIKTTSECTLSRYGDEKYHIRHQRIEEDWALKPSYKVSGSVSCGLTAEELRVELPKCASGMLESEA